MRIATGRDDYTILLSLTTAYVAFTRLPHDRQPRTEMANIRKLIRGYQHEGLTSMMFAEIVMNLNPGADFQVVYDEFADKNCLKYLPSSAEIAGAVVFFASPLSKAVTGQSLPVNCGEFLNP